MLNHQWRTFFTERRTVVYFCLLVIVALFSVTLFSIFMCWNETRPGFVFNDPILKMIPAKDFSLITMSFTNIPFLASLFYIIRRPKKTVYFFFATILICLLRTTTLYLTPLDPPIGIIPLTDPVIEKLFYGGSVLLKDLFFSGHTANLVVIGLIVNHKIYSKIVFTCATIVGTLLMVQHVHYSIDVFAAPIFAIFAYKMSVKLGEFTLLRKYNVNT
jgi:hypothetical protein